MILPLLKKLQITARKVPLPAGASRKPYSKLESRIRVVPAAITLLVAGLVILTPILLDACQQFQSPESKQATQFNFSDQSASNTEARSPIELDTNRNWHRQAMQMMQTRSDQSSLATELAQPRANEYPVAQVAYQQAVPATENQSVNVPPIGIDASRARARAQAPVVAQAPARPQASYLPPVHKAPPRQTAASASGIHVQPEMQVHQHQQRRPQNTHARQAAYAESTPTPAGHPAQRVAAQSMHTTHATQAPTRTYGHRANHQALPGSFTRKNDSLSRFRQTQLSSKSLIHRDGPGLQDRISNLLAGPRNQIESATNQFAERTEQVIAKSRPRPANRDLAKNRNQTARQIPKKRSQGTSRPVRKTSPPAREQLLEQVARRDQVTRRREMAQADNPIRRASRAHESLEEVQEPTLAPPRNLNRISKAQRVAQATLSEPIPIEPPVDPLQDPFGDYPPLRPVNTPGEYREARNENGDPVSILNRPGQRQVDAPTRLPQSRKVRSYSAPQMNYAPGFQETDIGDGDFDGAPSFESQQDVPSQSPQRNAFDELDEEFNRTMDEDITSEDMEELPDNEGDFSDDLDDELGGDSEDDLDETPEGKSCEEFRTQLLNNPITTISLDISPPRSAIQGEYAYLSRTWTDYNGNVLGTGTMKSLSRGYVILEDGQKIPYARLSDPDLAAISDFWKIPDECTVGNKGFAGRNWVPQTFTWKATSLCHKPLYFENIQLERYGHSHGPFLQPVQSVAHFFTSLVTLPYQTSIHPPNECQYALGYYRPGNCAPWLKDPIPISLDGFKRQLEISTGMAFIP